MLRVVSQLYSVFVTSAIKYSPIEKESYNFDENKAKLKVLVRRLDLSSLVEGKLYFYHLHMRLGALFNYLRDITCPNCPTPYF